MDEAYLLNGISPKMFNHKEKNHLFRLETIKKDEYYEYIHNNECINAIGHPNIAEKLGLSYSNRCNIQLEKGDIAYIYQGTDGRKYAVDSNIEISRYYKLKVYR